MAARWLHPLIELARKPSGDRRRELLREITELFLAQPADPAQAALFDQVTPRIAGEMDAVARAELAVRLAPTGAPLPRLLRDLGGDAIAVAEPVLRQATGFRDEDLLVIARTRSQDHLRALARRDAAPEALTQIIVERGDDTTLAILLGNEGAALSREASETAVDRARANPGLHAAVVERRSLPPDLLNEMYFVVEARLRARIIARTVALDDAALEAALEAGRPRLEARAGQAPPDLAESEAHVEALAARGELTPKMLARFLREGRRTRLIAALARLAEIDFHTARQILDGRRVDPLAIACKAAGLDRALFLTFGVLMLEADDTALGHAGAYGHLYGQLSGGAACRAARVWRLGRRAAAAAA